MGDWDDYAAYSAMKAAGVSADDAYVAAHREGLRMASAYMLRAVYGLSMAEIAAVAERTWEQRQSADLPVTQSPS